MPAPCCRGDALGRGQALPEELRQGQDQPSLLVLGLPTAVSQALFMTGNYTVVVTRSPEQHVLT